MSDNYLCGLCGLNHGGGVSCLSAMYPPRVGVPNVVDHRVGDDTPDPRDATIAALTRERDEARNAWSEGAAALVEGQKRLEAEIVVRDAQLAERVIAPDRCPLTGLPFFMAIDGVATYGGPFDSYTIPTRDDDGTYTRRHYDHDEGGWSEDEGGVEVLPADEATAAERRRVIAIIRREEDDHEDDERWHRSPYSAGVATILGKVMDGDDARYAIVTDDEVRALQDRVDAAELAEENAKNERDKALDERDALQREVEGLRAVKAAARELRRLHAVRPHLHDQILTENGAHHDPACLTCVAADTLDAALKEKTDG